MLYVWRMLRRKCVEQYSLPCTGTHIHVRANNSYAFKKSLSTFWFSMKSLKKNKRNSIIKNGKNCRLTPESFTFISIFIHFFFIFFYILLHITKFNNIACVKSATFANVRYFPICKF